MPGGRPDRPPLDEEKVSRWAGADTVDLVSQLTRKDLTLDRREVTQALATIAFGSPLLEALERWLAGSGDHQRPGRPGSVGYQEVAQIEYAARLFREWDDQFGGGLRRKAVIGQLNEVADLLGDWHPADIRQRLFGVMSHLAETAAMMSWDSGYQGLAQRYYVMAFRAAKTAGDWSFGAYALAGMARQLLYLGHPMDALELVRVAQETSAGHATPAVRAMLYTREAWGYANLGRVTAFERATDNAEEALADSRSADEPYWIGYFDQAELEGTTGGRLLELAHQDKRYAGETIERISRAVALRGAGRLRSSALDQIGLAEASLIEGECEKAAAQGEAATAVVEQTLSDRVRVKLVELYRTSDAHASVPAIADLRERIRSVLATPQPA
jgi:hypothetical protein